MNTRHKEDWDVQDTYWANRGGYWSGREGRAKSTNPHDMGSPARHVFDTAWKIGHADAHPHQCRQRTYLVLGAVAAGLAAMFGYLAAVIV
ncbi:hypothetical protein LCGC14_2450350 [marine sediment metagenome]|uniref:Uncharacterized protein n=1 Tax=marine sediment metagenome TaxID=412755 RepID=A0A0F9DTE7_9ZZZZ